MKILLLGGNGELGPHVVKALEKMHTLRITDINNLETDHEYIKVDSSDTVSYTHLTLPTILLV